MELIVPSPEKKRSQQPAPISRSKRKPIDFKLQDYHFSKATAPAKVESPLAWRALVIFVDLFAIAATFWTLFAIALLITEANLLNLISLTGSQVWITLLSIHSAVLYIGICWKIAGCSFGEWLCNARLFKSP